jgi:twitching motility protein PilT
LARLDELLTLLKTNDGSDLHLVAGSPPRMRAQGRLAPIDGRPVIPDSELRSLMRELPSEKGWMEYEATHDLDFAYALEGVARFRANYFDQASGAGAVFRIIPENIIPLEKLKVSPAIEGLAHLNQGLVLVTGPTGSGKSTTLAAIINDINAKYSKHIVTIEDPVEFVHRNRSAIFSHREVGLHTLGFGPALRSAIRQDADVILVGEMRERETIELAITAAEMGMLVFGTLHTNNASKTIDRIIDAFPADEQNMVRLSLSESLAGIVSQLLVPTPDGKGRVACNEILLRTSGLPNVIREGNTQMINSIIQAGKHVGMQQMDDVLFEYAEAKKITAHDALMKATDKARFEPLLAAD